MSAHLRPVRNWHASCLSGPMDTDTRPITKACLPTTGAPYGGAGQQERCRDALTPDSASGQAVRWPFRGTRPPDASARRRSGASQPKLRERIPPAAVRRAEGSLTCE